MDRWYRFLITEDDLPLVAELRGDEKDLSQYIGWSFGCLESVVLEKIENVVAARYGGFVVYNGQVTHFIIESRSPKKVPWMNPAIHRTVSSKRAAGRKKHKPTHGWSKARKRFFITGS